VWRFSMLRLKKATVPDGDGSNASETFDETGEE
jgi:hypothetical protein